MIDNHTMFGACYAKMGKSKEHVTRDVSRAVQEIIIAPD